MGEASERCSPMLMNPKSIPAVVVLEYKVLQCLPVCVCSRADLLTLYERVILTDIEFSDSQNLDQALWKNVFYQVIERFRQVLKDPSTDTAPRIRTMLLTLLDEVQYTNYTQAV